MSVYCSWRGEFSNDALNALHAEAFNHQLLKEDWWSLVNRHSLGWVCAMKGDTLIGFVNVAWDGGVHAFVLDAMVSAEARGQGVGTELVRVAVQEARKAGCEWLHVDFEDRLQHFYFDMCGFKPIGAGLIRL